MIGKVRADCELYSTTSNTCPTELDVQNHRDAKPEWNDLLLRWHDERSPCGKLSSNRSRHVKPQ